ncbi:MAG TPA: amidohydrolase family protein [Longimicrobiaceae bacterium]|nr:amidohydrolase family protein [Longimicrobiaceae bacterium]
MKRTFVRTLLLAAAVGSVPLAAQERAQAFRGATLLPIASAPIADGVLVVRGGKIVAVGGPSTPIPAGAEVHDVAGKIIMPGLVDTHSHIGGGDGGDQSTPLHPAVRILDTIDPRNPGIRRARAGGVTTVNVMPGSGLLMSGQTAYLKLRDAHSIDGLLFCSDPVRDVCGGLKMANGTNPRGSAPHPGTRARAAAIVRDRFVKAREYREKVRAARGDASKMPARDLELETLAEVLDGKRVVHFHTHRADDILTVLRLREEFGFRVVLQHASEAYKVADQIAAARVPASIIALDAPGGKLEASEYSNVSGAALERAGAPLIAFHTDDGITDSRFFLRSAAMGVRFGLSRERALRAVTLDAAEMMDLGDRVGSLERGKDADFIILSGDPFSTYTHVEQTWIEGRKVFDRADPEQRKLAVGGYGVYRGTAMHTHEGEEGHE